MIFFNKHLQLVEGGFRKLKDEHGQLKAAGQEKKDAEDARLRSKQRQVERDVEHERKLDESGRGETVREGFRE